MKIVDRLRGSRSWDFNGFQTDTVNLGAAP